MPADRPPERSAASEARARHRVESEFPPRTAKTRRTRQEQQRRGQGGQAGSPQGEPPAGGGRATLADSPAESEASEERPPCPRVTTWSVVKVGKSKGEQVGIGWRP